MSAAAQLKDGTPPDNTVYVMVTMLASIAIILTTGIILSAAVAYYTFYSRNDEASHKRNNKKRYTNIELMFLLSPYIPSRKCLLQIPVILLTMLHLC